MSSERQRQSLIAFFLGRAAATKKPESPAVITSASRRAYRDLSRTLHGMGNHPDAESLRTATDQSIVEFVDNLTDINTVAQFNEFHKRWCTESIARFANAPHPDRHFSLSYGQAQKWLNMALKYLAVLGHETVNSVYDFLHIPVDRIIYEQAKNLGVPTPERTAWSRLGKKQYDEYQKALREKIKATFGDHYAPLDWETDKWIERSPVQE